MRLYQVLVVVFALSEGAAVQPSYGRLPGNVTGGEDTPPERWPWFAGLYTNGSFFCSGSLISDQWVMTAGLCLSGVESSDVTVFLGLTNQTGSSPNNVSRGFSQAVCHPLFNTSTFDNAICLLKLSSPVEFSDRISPVCLAAENSTFPNGTFSWIIGFPKDGIKVPAKLQLQILGNNECRNQSAFKITDNMICTRKDLSSEKSCLSTSGSPLLIHNDDLVWIQHGISFHPVICSKMTSPGVYIRVSSYQDWIRNVTGSNVTGSNVTGSNVTGSNVTGSNVTGSNVTGSSQPCFVHFPSSGDDGVYISPSSPPRMSTTPHVTPPEQCKTPPVVPPRTTCDRSIFDSSEKLSSTFFTSIFALLFSLVVLLV